jgi:hypothetical protein
MWQRWQQFLRRPFVWSTVGAAALINLATWVLLLVNLSTHSGNIVLHYTVYFGVDLVGSWERSLLIPAFGLLLLAFNTAVAKAFLDTQRMFSAFFLVLTPIFELLLLFAAIFIVLANFPVGR